MANCDHVGGYSPRRGRHQRPTLVLSGEPDQVDTLETLRRELPPRIAGARLQVVPGAGHLSMLEVPEALARYYAFYRDAVLSRALHLR